MTVHIHHLAGCAPTPLAHYLKALGILRLVAEQKDPNARGWWENQAFQLATTLDTESLQDFFLNEYQPTPTISPWNKGSGFSHPPNNPSLDFMRKSNAVRLLPFRNAIAQTDKFMNEMIAADKAIRAIKNKTKNKEMSKAQRTGIRNSPEYKKELADAEKKFGGLKKNLIPLCRKNWRGPHLAWMDAALTINVDNEAKFPAILGTGGNDGKNDFTKQFMECLGKLFEIESGQASRKSKALLVASLQANSIPDALTKLPIGQFMPGTAGGVNMTNGFSAEAEANPWDYVFNIEGILFLKPALTRKTNPRAPTSAAAPFAVHQDDCGYASATANGEKNREEQWMPLWEHPASLFDIENLFADGRVMQGRNLASRPLGFARALARLGVARGVKAFQRYGYIERNGQANLAVPLGRWDTTPNPQLNLLDDLDQGAWLDRSQRAAKDNFAPNSFVMANHRLFETILGACAHGSETHRWQTILLALAELERQMILSGKFTKEKRLRPIPPLAPGWMTAADDASPEFRLAVALALQGADESGRDGIRPHFLPLEPNGRQFATDLDGLRKDPRVVAHGLEPERDLIALLQRRLIEGSSGALSRLPLISFPGYHARMSDLNNIFSGEMDMRKIISLARAFMAIDRKALRQQRPKLSMPMSKRHPPPIYSLFRLSCLPWPLQRNLAETHVRVNPAILTRLASGNLIASGNLAVQQLKAAGIVPIVRHVCGDAQLALRLALSLAFPISKNQAAQLAEMVTKPQTEGESA